MDSIGRLKKNSIRDTMIRARTALERCLEYGIADTTSIRRRIGELTKAIVELEKIPES